MERVSLVEDEDVIRQNIADFLRGRGYDVDAYPNRADAAEAFALSPPDLAILDVALGDERDGGFRLCADLRASWKALPIIFLTAHMGDADKISGLRLGADDYLSKESSMEFLAVRIETLLTRCRVRNEAFQSHFPSECQSLLGPLEVDDDRSEARWRGRPVALTLTQFWMVRALALHPAQPVSHDALMRAARIHVAPNTVTAHIRSIRQHFEAVDPDFHAIRTERGLGYRWIAAEVE